MNVFIKGSDMLFQRLSWGVDEIHRGWNSKFSSKSGKRPLSLTQSWGCDVKVITGKEPGLMHMLFFSFGEGITDVRRYSHMGDVKDYRWNSEEVGHGPKGILVTVINQSEHCIHSLVFSEKISPRNISWFWVRFSARCSSFFSQWRSLNER